MPAVSKHQEQIASRNGSNVPAPASRPAAPQPRPDRLAGAFAPDFFVIGAMKGGTTTLYRYLDQFPAIGLSRIKETDYFIAGNNHALGEAWYRRQFDLDRPLLGEVSPNYSKFDIFPGVPERIARVAPGAKLIFIARDPVARFASHYRHSWSFGHMRVKPADLLRSDNGRHMIESSRYGAQIERFLVHFDRNQFLFLDFDTLCEAPQHVCDEVADFLGIERREIQTELPANTADQVARIPAFVKRAARSTLARRLDRFIPGTARKILRRALAIRKPERAPELDARLLEEVADLVRADARHFREISGMEFGLWRV